MDRARIQQIIALLKDSESAELAIRGGNTYVRILRSPESPEPTPCRVASADANALQVGAMGPRTAPDDGLVRAKLVGRFYAGKGPGQPPLVSVGDRVEEGQVIASIEALGTMTGVPSVETGDVVEILCEDGAPVQYGDPLVRLRRARERTGSE